MPDLRTRLCEKELEHPLILGAGVLGGTASSLLRIERSGAAAVTTKSIGLERREGWQTPIVAEAPAGLLNAVGLPSPGIEEALEELRLLLKEAKVPVIVSFYGSDAEEVVRVASMLQELEPSFLELNASCPTVEEGVLGYRPRALREVVRAVKKAVDARLLVKLPASHAIADVARAAEGAGADGLVAINSVPAMRIDVRLRRPILARGLGGLSGPAIKPIAVRCVYEIFETTDLPIVGIGGVLTGEDALEMIMAGASAVGIATGVLYRGLGVFREVKKELEEQLERNGFSSLREAIGAAH